jgi:uncharacterized protein YndB with AHSA1/START domain
VAPIEVRNELLIKASPERVWDVLTYLDAWPSWYRACKWVRRDEATGDKTSFRWKAHPVELRSRVVEAERGRSFSFTSEAAGLRALRTFTLRPSPDGAGTVVVAHETQWGPLPWLGRAYLGPRLSGADQVWLADLARATETRRAMQARAEVRPPHGVLAKTFG